ncbi:hypothetical protein Aduo_010179 [Ancylostoma duodenale]
MHRDSETSKDYAPPPPYVSAAPPAVLFPQFAKEVFNLSTSAKLPLNGFTYGNRIRVLLQPLVNYDGRFAINLRNGDGDILLHFNPRLKERVVVFNTHNNGKWQYEERLSFLFPFERLRVYTIDLSSSGRNSVIIYLNGQFLFEFRQRQFPFKSASAVEVSGDVSIHSIHIA